MLKSALARPPVEPVEILPDGRLCREHAARYIGVKPATLAVWASQGKGPRSFKTPGIRRVYYYQKDLDDFIRDGNGRKAA